MCGIVGAASFKVRTTGPELWNQTLASLRHRGPDDFDYNVTEDVFLGHTRLRVIDQSSAANQPMISSDGRWHLVFNGEIYNFRELASDLNLGDHVNSDSRVLIESIAQKGVLATVKTLRGMFAIGVFDVKEQEFWLLRDQFGEKPLYYFNDSSHFVFASEINGLVSILSGFGVRVSPNLEIFDSYMLQGFVPGQDTAVQNLFRLPPSGYLRARRKGGSWQIVEGKWAAEWEVESSETIPTDRMLEQALSHAISGQLIADVPVGCFLSGGVDSSLVTLLAVEQMRSTTMHTFSVGFENQSFDETSWGEIVASRLKTKHHRRVMTGDDALEMYLRRKTLKLDLLADPSILPTMFLSQQAKNHVTVALSGDGADELFGGYRRYVWFSRLATITSIPGTRLLIQNVSKLRGLRKFSSPILDARLDRLLTSATQKNKVGQYMPLLSPGFPSNTMESERFKDLIWAMNDNESRRASGVDWARAYDVRTYLPGDILPKVDQASMAFSLEVRAPFLDKDVAYLASRFPSQALRSNGGKSVLKRLVAKRFGQEFANRPKMGFGPPLTEWLNGPLSHEIRASLSGFDWESVGLNPNKIRSLERDLAIGQATDGTLIWALSQFANEFSDLTEINFGS